MHIALEYLNWNIFDDLNLTAQIKFRTTLETFHSKYTNPSFKILYEVLLNS